MFEDASKMCSVDASVYQCFIMEPWRLEAYKLPCRVPSFWQFWYIPWMACNGD
jgi:hypothetical protein